LKRRRLGSLLLAAWMAVSGLGLSVPPAEGATRKSTRSSTSVKKKKAPAPSTTVRKKAAPRKTVRRTAARKKKPSRPTAAQRAAARREAARRRAEEKRRREAARREAERRQREALARAWQSDKGCYESGTAFQEPRLKSHDEIDVPSAARGSAMKAALLLYEAQLNKDGSLYSLRTLKPLPREHPWPMLHEAVVKSLRQWKWDRTKVAGRTIPVCFPVTLNLDLR
jgi:hypothetical protein